MASRRTSRSVKKAYKAWRHSVETLENFNYEFQLKRKADGMYRWHVCRATAIISENGIVESWVGTISDIEDQVAKEKAKDEFIATASHEIRTPLTSATAFLQLLEYSMKQNNNPDLVYAQKAAASLKKLNYLVSELLDANKIKQGKLGLNITSFNFNEMLSQAIEIAQISAPNHIIMLSRKINRKIKGDQERLQQVIINLLHNAVKYSPNAEKIFVHATVEKGNLKVSVKDEGVGINKKNLNKIFDRYYREDEQEKRFSGLGIGLSICKDIIQKHNGKIWAESEPGKGSTFYFTIPL